MKTETHYIKAGWLIDGSGAPVQKNVLLTVKSGTILNISRFNIADLPDPSLTTDLSHCTILPPLADSHVHLALSSSLNPATRKHQLSASYKERKPWIAAHIHSLISHGVLAVRDGGDQHAHVFRYKNENKSGKNTKNPLVLKATTRALHRKGRYGSFLGRAVAKREMLSTAAVKNTYSADHIKLINSGLNCITEFAKETTSQFSIEELENLVCHLQNRKQKLMVHANGQTPVRDAVEAGCHSIEHGFFMGTENLKRMADKQTFWVPTAVTMKALLDNWETGIQQGDRDVIRKTLDAQLELMSCARQDGVRLALGTDAGGSGIVHGKSVADELRLFLQAGYSLAEAVQCASTHGAELLGTNTICPITKNRSANFIVIPSSPATLPDKLSAIAAIYLAGQPITF